MSQFIGSELYSNMTGELPSFIKAHFSTEKKAEAFIINAVVEALESQERENTGSFLALIKKISCVQPSQSNDYHQEGSFSTCSEKDDEASDNESGATAEVNALRQDLEQKQLELTALQEQLKEAHQEISKLTLNVRAHAQTIDKLTTEKLEVLAAEKQAHADTQNVLAAEKQAHYELKYQYQNLETRYNSSEEVCASLRSELAIEKEAHEDTCNVLAAEKQAHYELKYQYQNLETRYNSSEEVCASLRSELAIEKEAHEDTCNVLAVEKQAHQVTRDQIRIYLSNIEAERNTVSANREKWREEYQQLQAKFLAKEQSEQEWKKQQDSYEQERIQLKTYLVQSEAERNELAMLCQNLRAENKQLRDAKEKNN